MVASNGGLTDITSQEYGPPVLPLGMVGNVGSRKIKVAVGVGVTEAVTVGDGVKVGVKEGVIKIAVWLAAMAAVCAMITSSSPGASVGTGVLADGKSKGAQAHIAITAIANNILRTFFDIITKVFFIRPKY
jgi:hypothetical protein